MVGIMHAAVAASYTIDHGWSIIPWRPQTKPQLACRRADRRAASFWCAIKTPAETVSTCEESGRETDAWVFDRRLVGMSTSIACLKWPTLAPSEARACSQQLKPMTSDVVRSRMSLSPMAS
jgi:hypothetical protein